MAKSNSLLDLSTTGEIKRKHFTIDGISYEIRDLDEMPLTDQQRLSHAGGFIKKYFEEEADSIADAKAKTLLNHCIDLICVKLPVKIRDKLGDRQKFKLFNAFNEANGLNIEAKKK